MNRLTLKSIRDLRALGLRGVMVALLIACQSAIFTGGLCSRITLRRSADDFCDAYNLADLQVSFDVTSSKRLRALDDLDGVKKAGARLMVDGAIHLTDGTMIPAAVIFIHTGQNPRINTLDIEEGVFPTKTGPGAVIEHGLRERGYDVGDTITLSAYGFQSTRPIVGIARSPEFLVSTANPEMLIPIPGSLGVVFVPVESCKKEMKALSLYAGGADPVNQMLFVYGEGRDGREGPAGGIERRIMDRFSAAGIEILSVVRRNEQFGITFLRQDLKVFRALVLAIVGIFSVVTLIATGITVNRLVASQSREIGALMALGYRPGTIMLSYLRLGLLVGCGGGAIGLVASPAVNYLLAGAYASAIDLPGFTLSFDPATMVMGLLLGIGVASAAALAPIVRLVRLTPIQVMRGEIRAPLLYCATCARVMGAVAGALSASLPERAAVRNLFRRPRLTAATILLLTLGLGVTAGFVVTLTSVIESSASLLRGYGWDMMVDFMGPTPCDAGVALCEKAGLAMPEPFVRGYASVGVGGAPAADYQVVGVPARSGLGHFRIVDGSGFSGDGADEIVLNASFSDGPLPAPGDMVSVKTGGRTHRLKVAGLVSLLSSRQCFVPIETARRIFRLQGKCLGVTARLEGVRSAEVEKRLYSSSDVRRVTAKSELENAIHDQLAKGTGLIWLAIVIGSVVALAIVINTMSMNILERDMEFATLMSLGYGRLPLSGMVLTEVLVMGIAALVIAAPVTVGIAGLMNAELSRVWFNIDTCLRLRDFVTALFVPFMLLPIGAAPALRHVFRLDIARAVRERIIE
jgi:putative ABC transport system permease protein